MLSFVFFVFSSSCLPAQKQNTTNCSAPFSFLLSFLATNNKSTTPHQSLKPETRQSKQGTAEAKHKQSPMSGTRVSEALPPNLDVTKASVAYGDRALPKLVSSNFKQSTQQKKEEEEEEEEQRRGETCNDRAHSFTHSFTHTHTHSFTHTFLHSLLYSLLHSLLHSLLYSLLHSLLYSLLHSLLHWQAQLARLIPGI